MSLPDVWRTESAGLAARSGVFEEGVAAVRAAFASFKDRRQGKNKHYTVMDAALSAFAVFFAQSPSWLAHQRAMEAARGCNNARTLFHVERIPTDIHVRWLLDPVSPRMLDPAFAALLALLWRSGALAAYKGVGDMRLVALDATQYHASEAIHCANCTHKHHADGRDSYHHTAVTPVMVAPGNPEAIPLRPEFIMPQDGHDKQDCEIAASKRWVEAQFGWLRASATVLLGDDLYSHSPFCRWVLRHCCHFLFVCLRESHRATYEYLDLLESADVQVAQAKRQDKHGHTETWVVRVAADVPLAADAGALRITWLDLTVTDAQGQTTYRNAWATDLQVTPENAIAMAESARSRWVIENGNNNVLKTKGYHLEHNFGHGKQNLAALLAAMNILAFLLHTLLAHADANYKLVRQTLATRTTFFQHVQTLTTYLCFASWAELLDFMMKGLEIGPYAPPGGIPRTRKGLRKRNA